MKKTVLSLMLFGAYALGLAHNIIPHCHHQEFGEGQHIQHDIELHHAPHLEQHNPDELAIVSDHEHGIFDFLVFAFGKAKHPLFDGEACLYTTVDEKVNNLDFSSTFLFLHLFLQTTNTVNENKEGYPVLNCYLLCTSVNHSITSPRRGPPEIS